ncbi:MAG: hypothetical protein OES57_08645 [Acidimicrobiia bacterium]|nr:hypothetical protein [Acidimicrobiia bacterium]
MNQDVTDVDFVLFEASGNYTFDVWFGGRPAGETGTVWLEATDEIRGRPRTWPG